MTKNTHTPSHSTDEDYTTEEQQIDQKITWKYLIYNFY